MLQNLKIWFTTKLAAWTSAQEAIVHKNLIANIVDLQDTIIKLMADHERAVKELKVERGLKEDLEKENKILRKKDAERERRFKLMKEKQDAMTTVIEIVMVNADLPRHKKDNIRFILNKEI